ncbi:hypothetical protein TYRP_002346 [Tyrophagus putrescentiae]|nr:hypothetical protein TYRP_002346 [Tyrophagus putrescentiae]
MPPLRPLSDLCLIFVFKQLTPTDQLKASLMSFRCKVLVRAANRRVKTLAITYWDEVEVIKKEISKFSLSCNPSMQLTSGEPFPDYPAMTDRLSQWNCLRLKLDTPNIEQIVYVFSAVTDLKLIVRSNDQIESLLHLLSHPQWTGQLSNLLFHNYCDLSPELASRLITAINGLSALQHLAIKFGRGEAEIPGLSTLTILAQLKTITVEFGDKCVRPFLRSLERNATENVNLQVHLFAEDNDALFSLSEPFRNQIVRYALECYRKAALHKLHRGVHLKKIILAMEKLPLDQLPTSYHF